MTFGIPRVGCEFPSIRWQYRDQIEARNEKAERDCSNPIYVPNTGRDAAMLPLNTVRCRKCDNCNAQRKREWVERVAKEWYVHERTWFLTFTFAECLTVINQGKRNEMTVSPKMDSETFTEPLYPEYADIQLWLKRIRKKHKVKFLSVEEFGEKNGRLHWHIVLHSSRHLTGDEMQRHWDYGKLHSKLVTDSDIGSYIAKYVTKAGKLRGSVGYGKTDALFEKLGGRAFEDFEYYVRTGKKTGLLNAEPEISIAPVGRHIAISATDVNRIRLYQQEEALERNGSVDHEGDIPW
jgi:hypothetical protein